jgi:hypothetical protein
MALCFDAAPALATVFLGPTFEGDTDADGVVDISDNAPVVGNPAQADSDNDGLGDVLESTSADTDGDSIADGFDPDADGDGIIDGFDPNYLSGAVTSLSFSIGGPYTVTSGSPLTLSYSLAPLPLFDHLVISLDVDADSSIDAWWVGLASDGMFTLSAAEVQSLGLDVGAHAVDARAGSVLWSFADSTLVTAIPEAPPYMSLGTICIGLIGVAACKKKLQRRSQ